nr:uncharacterized protein LOC105871562 [Microcebus murinus]
MGCQTANGCGVTWMGVGEKEKSPARQGAPLPNSTPLQPASKRLPGSFASSRVFTAFTRAEGLPGSERQEKVCRAFKVIQRSSRLRRRDAAHGSPAAVPDSGTRRPPGGPRPGPGCRWLSGPQALGSHRGSQGSEPPMWQSPSESLQSSTKYLGPFRGKEAQIPQLRRVASRNLRCRPLVASSSETVNSPSDLAFRWGWGGHRRLLPEFQQPPRCSGLGARTCPPTHGA